MRDDSAFRDELRAYLRAHTTLPRSVEMLLTSIAMAADANWRAAPEHLLPIRARGWFLGRWLPTFLIFDGPIGRFMRSDDSPLASRYGSSFPMLTGARDFIADKTFRALRNGFAHWSFDWEVVERESFVVAYEWERDLPIAKLHQAEADAYHIAAFALVENLDSTLLRPRDIGVDAPAL